VLAGHLRLILSGEEHRLEPGEQVEFDSSLPHWFGPADQRAVEILHLFVPDGERPVTRVLPDDRPR
jgi:quercetin dioxygenase-like cupin family protein